MFLASFSPFSRARRAASKPGIAAPAPQLDVRELARRVVPRDAIDFRTTVTIGTIGEVDARIMDISPYGFQARGPSSRILERGERVTLVLPVVGTWGADVMWGLKGLFGCKFVERIEPELYAELLATLRASDLGTDVDPETTPDTGAAGQG